MSSTNTGTSNAIKDFADRFGITLMNEAQAGLSPQLRELHRAILSAFVDTGAAPTVAWITDRSSLLGLDPDQALARLAEADLVHTADGAVTVAYPFSGTPTPHRVQFTDGTAVWAMCGGDALGIPLMTGRSAIITSTDPHTGDPIRIRWHNGSWTWEPSGTVMLIAGVTGCATAAEAACRHIHFFANPDNAEAHLRANPALGGEVYDQAASVEVSQIVFGPLLDRLTDTHGSRSFDMTTIESEVQRYISVIRTNLQQPDVVPQLYRLLAAGEPVTVARLATEGGWSVEDLRAELTRHPGTDWDEHGRIVGFNLTLRPTAHTFTFDSHTVYAFCASGALELPIVLGRPGVIESPCPATGQRIRVQVTPSSVVRVDPPQAVVSKVRPTEPVADVRSEICGLGHFFSSPAAAADWLAHYPQGQVDPVADEFEIIRQAMTEVGWAAVA